MLENKDRKSRNSLKVEILQLWNSETEEIEYYKGKKLIRSFLIFAIVLTLSSCVSKNVLADNWDLSAKRATSDVRLLQVKYGIAPERMTAMEPSEFVPKTSNSTVEGKAAKRRTEIIILPKLDEFFELLEPTTSKGK